MKGTVCDTDEDTVRVSAESMREFDGDGRFFSDPYGLLSDAVNRLRQAPIIDQSLSDDLDYVQKVMAHPDFKRAKKGSTI